MNAQGQGPNETPDEIGPDLGQILEPLKALEDWQSRWVSTVGQQAVAAFVANLDLPPIRLGMPGVASPAFEALGKQLAGMTQVGTLATRAMEPVFQQIREQWQGLFRSLQALRDQLYPENLQEAYPSLEDLETLLIDEGIPLMWVPGPSVVRALLDAPDPATRRRVIGRRWKGVVNDCETVLESVDHPDLGDTRGFACDVTSALRDGHTSAAQALAANLLDTVIRQHLDDNSRLSLTKNEFRQKGVKFDLDRYRLRVALSFAPVWHAYAQYWPENGDRIQRVFGRHASAHGVSTIQYSRINAVTALMLVTSVIKFFDQELPRSTEA